MLLSQRLLRNPYLPEVRAEWDRLAEAGELPGWGSDLSAWVDWLAAWGEAAPAFDADLVAARFAQGGPDDAGAALAAFAAEADRHLGKERLELATREAEVVTALDRMAGHSDSMVALRAAAWSAAFGRNLAQVAAAERLLLRTPVLIHGRTGVGKELVATAIAAARPWANEEREGRRRTRTRYEPVHLGSIPKELVPSALFGYERGAFTGAKQPQQGVLTRCHGGAVFLDEIGELPEHTQVALLRCLQEGQVRPLGGEKPIPAAPRVISATHRDLPARVEEGTFREDLLQRIGAVRIEVVPLARRREDIDDLVLVLQDMLGIDLELQGLVKTEFDRWAREDLPSGYGWPGNVRELEAVVRSIALGIAPRLSGDRGPPAERGVPRALGEAGWSMARLRGWYARRALREHGTKTDAAHAIGVARTTFDRYLEGSDGLS